MSDLDIFLQYIGGLDEDQAAHEPGAVVGLAYQGAVAELAELKQQTARFIRPINNGKAWVVGFDPDRIGEVAAIGTGIDECNRNIKSICNDIEQIVAIGDSPESGPLFVKLQSAQRRLRTAKYSAAAAVQTSVSKNPGMQLDEVQKLPKVAEAYNHLAEIEETVPAIIAELEERVSKRRDIYRKYEVV